MTTHDAGRRWRETVRDNSVVIPYIAIVVTLILVLALRDLLR